MSTVLARNYAYRGRDASGKLTKGRMEAPSQAAVVTRLRGMGLAPVHITEAAPNTGLNREISLDQLLGSRVKLKDLTIMAREMATMISAGLSLLRTLDILAEQTDNKKLGSVL